MGGGRGGGGRACESVWSRDDAVVRALASHHCGLGSILRLGIFFGLSLLLVLGLAMRGFSLGTLVFPSPQKPRLLNSYRTECGLLFQGVYSVSVLTRSVCSMISIPGSLPSW